MRCPRCGNENPATNRFCGMCGATMLAPAAPAPEPISRTAVPVVPPAPGTRPASRPPETRAESRADVRDEVRGEERAEVRAEERAQEQDEAAVISGPSFLGLNQPAPRASGSGSDGRRASLSINPNAAPASRDLDYLLEDDEPKRGGGWKAVVIFLALALAVGLGYLRWKNQGIGWLNLGSGKHSTSQSADDSNAGTAQSPTAAGQQNNSGAPAAASPPPASSPAANSPATTANGPGDSPANPSSPSADAASPATTRSPSDQTSAQPDAKQEPAPASAAKTPPAKDSADADDSNPSAASAPSTPPPAHSKPSAASDVVKPADPVAEAQKYLYGRGVPQNCDRGLRLLKPAADHANAKAMVEMGALYSAGLCTPRDLPTAYRWFAMALRKEPDNDSVQADLQKLWGEMTQPERQLAIKLSQ